MIKLRKLGPAELAEKIKKEFREAKIRLTRNTKPVYLPDIDKILLMDEYVFAKIPDSLVDEFVFPYEIIDSAVENHFQLCEFCKSGEPCPNLPSILAA